jgi:chorismate mutase
MDKILQLRKKLDVIDDQILGALGERAKICREIGCLKKDKGLQVRDATRESQVYQRVKVRAVEFGLDSQQLEAVYREIVNMCSAVQE